MPNLSLLFKTYNAENSVASQLIDAFITDLSSLSTVAIEGDKAETFLQGQLTCNMAEVTMQQTRLAAHCNPKGRVIAAFRIFKAQVGYYLQTPKEMLPIILPELNKYAVFSKVKLTDVNEQIISIGIGGTGAATALKEMLQVELAIDQATTWENCTITRIYSLVPRFVIIGAVMDVGKIKRLLSQKAITIPYQGWQLLDIWSGVATIEPATSGLFTPHMLNYPALNAVSFNKGCYIGQEIIARTHYLGKSKRQMHIVEIPVEKGLSVGDKLFNNQQQEIGTIVNLCAIANTYQALAIFSTDEMAANIKMRS